MTGLISDKEIERLSREHSILNPETWPKKRAKRQTTNAPTAADIRTARLAAGLTQSAAAALCYRSRRGWQDCERGLRQLDPAAWALFLIRSRKLISKAKEPNK